MTDQLVVVITIAVIPYCYIISLVACKAYFATKRQYMHEILNDMKE